MEPRRRRAIPGWALIWAVVLVVSVAAAGVVLSGGSRPQPSVVPSLSRAPSVPGPTQSAVACAISTPILHGSWWSEVGGPQAFFNWEGGTRPADWNPWLLDVRFDPDAGVGEPVSIWADRVDAADHQPGYLNGRADPHLIYRLDSPAPDLPGGWYLFEQRLPSPGCWRLSAALGDRVVGTAIVSVGPPSQSQPPIASPAPTPRIPPPDPLPTMPAETPGLGGERTARDVVYLYTWDLRDGRYEAAWEALAPEARVRWGSLAKFTEERSAYFKSSKVRSWVIHVWPTDIAPITDWLSGTYGASIDLRHAVLVKVDYPALAGNNAGFDIYIVRVGENGDGEIFDVR